ncbi:MAG: hypothetical protein ACK5JF_01915 [Oscillospiraceae bacterium]
MAAVCVPMVLSRIKTMEYAPDIEIAYWILGIVAIGVGIFLAVTILFSVAYFLLTKHLFTKKLNLE